MIDQPSQKILEFCWTNNIKTLPINLRVQDGKKTYLSGEEGRFEDGRYNFKMTDFPKLTFKECKALTELYADETEWIAIDTNEIQQLDIDDPSWEFDSEAVQLLIGENERIPYFPSITKKCPHFFIRTEKRKNCWRTTKVPCDHDVLSGQWSFAKRDQEVFDHNQPIPFKELPEKEPEGRKLQTKEPSMSQNPHPVTTLHASDVASTLSKEPEGQKLPTKDNVHQEIVKNIDPRKYYHYHNWLKFIWALRFGLGEEVGKELAIHYSSMLDNFVSEEDVCNYMEQAKEEKIGLGYLMRLSKMSNRMKHFQIIAKHTEVMKADDYNLARVAMQLLNDDVIKVEKVTADGKVCRTVYVFNEKTKYWTLENGLKKMMCDRLRQFYTQMDIDLTKSMQGSCDDEQAHKLAQEKKKAILKILGRVNSHSSSINILEELKEELPGMNVEFDSYQPYYFCFANCAFDVRTGKQVEVQKDDYITHTCGKTWRSPTEDELKVVRRIFHDTFPNEEIRFGYASVLKSGLTGVRPEMFVFATGTGRNGKGVINENFVYLLGDYAGTGHLCLLTKPIREGANTEMRSCHKKRWLLFSEPEDGISEKVRLSNVKALTGNERHKARGLYSSDDDTRVWGTNVCECNQLPPIVGDKGNAAQERIKVFPFQVEFTSDQSKIEADPIRYKQANNDLKSTKFKEEHYCAFFQYILHAVKGTDPIIPNVCKELGIKYLMQNDDFSNWFLDNYEPMPGAIVGVREVYRDYRESAYYRALPKAEQRRITQQTFTDTLRTNIALKKHFMPARTRANGKQLTKDCIMNYKQKSQYDSDDE